MSSAKVARHHNRILKQRKYQKRVNDYISPFQQYTKYSETHKNCDNCNTFRGIELAKEMLKTNRNIEEVANKVDEIICDELYEIYLQNQEPDPDYYDYD